MLHVYIADLLYIKLYFFSLKILKSHFGVMKYYLVEITSVVTAKLGDGEETGWKLERK